MNSHDRYPKHNSIINHPADLDGYVAATHEPRLISANAFELRLRSTDEALGEPEAYLSGDLSTQERGILRGVIALLEMSSEGSRVDLYTTSEGVTKALKGEHRRSKNLDLLESIFRTVRERRIALNPVYVARGRGPRGVVLEKLKLMARAVRDEWLSRNPIENAK